MDYFKIAILTGSIVVFLLVAYPAICFLIVKELLKEKHKEDKKQIHIFYKQEIKDLENKIEELKK